MTICLSSDTNKNINTTHHLTSHSETQYKSHTILYTTILKSINSAIINSSYKGIVRAKEIETPQKTHYVQHFWNETDRLESLYGVCIYKVFSFYGKISFQIENDIMATMGTVRMFNLFMIYENTTGSIRIKLELYTLKTMMD